jgi:C-terminal processing protease CtpA/Prc
MPPPQQQQQFQQQQLQPQQPGSMSGMYGTQQSNSYQEPLFPDMHTQQPNSLMQMQPQGMYGAPYGAPPYGPPGFGSGPFPPQAGPPPIPDYVDKYEPKQPDRFGLGIVFQPYGQGQIRVKELVPGGPAELSGEPIHVGDWLYEIDGKMVFKQPISQTLRLLQAKKKGDPVHLGLRHSGDRHLTGVMIVKGKTGVKLSNAGIGIVFKQDPPPGTWVRVAQVIPGGPAMSSVGDGVIRVNDRVMEVNGMNVAQQDLKLWQHLLRGKEGTQCILTLADVNAELYTCNIIRGYVDQTVVDHKSINVPSPIYEAPVKIQPKLMAPDKKYLPNLSGVSCGISFLVNDQGEVVVDHVQKGGPASQVGQISPGDVLLEIGDGPDVDPAIFPMREVYRMPVESWSEIIKKGVPQTHCKFVFKKSEADEKYEVLVKRELLVDLQTGQEQLFTVGIAFAAHGKSVYVDQGGLLPNSSASKEGVREGYILQAIEREPMNGKVDDLQTRMNELLIGPEGTPVNIIFQTAAGNMQFRIMRDVPLNMTPMRGPPKPRTRIEPEKPAPSVLPFNTSGLGPGSGVYTQPMCNPVLWASLIEEGQPMDGDESRFQWRGRILKQPEYDEHGIATVSDAITNELIYRGPGVKEKRLPGMKLPTSRAQGGSAAPFSAPPQEKRPNAASPGPAAPPPAPAAAPAPPQQQQQPPTPPPAAPAAPAPPPQAPPPQAPAPPSPPTSAAAPPSQQQAAAPAPPGSNQSSAAQPPADGTDMDDDESSLVLTDGRNVDAKRLEEVRNFSNAARCSYK